MLIIIVRSPLLYNCLVLYKAKIVVQSGLLPYTIIYHARNPGMHWDMTVPMYCTTSFQKYCWKTSSWLGISVTCSWTADLLNLLLWIAEWDSFRVYQLSGFCEFCQKVCRWLCLSALAVTHYSCVPSVQWLAFTLSSVTRLLELCQRQYSIISLVYFSFRICYCHHSNPICCLFVVVFFASASFLTHALAFCHHWKAFSCCGATLHAMVKRYSFFSLELPSSQVAVLFVKMWRSTCNWTLGFSQMYLSSLSFLLMAFTFKRLTGVLWLPLFLSLFFPGQ